MIIRIKTLSCIAECQNVRTQCRIKDQNDASLHQSEGKKRGAITELNPDIQNAARRSAYRDTKTWSQLKRVSISRRIERLKYLYL